MSKISSWMCPLASLPQPVQTNAPMQCHDLLQRDVLWLCIVLHHHEPEEGYKLFDVLPNKDSISWNTTFNEYERNRRMDDAMDLFDIMPSWNVISWNIVNNGFFKSGMSRGQWSILIECRSNMQSYMG